MKRARKILAVPLLATLVLAGCFGRKKQKPEAGTAAEPDKVLFERAIEDIKHNHYEVARLTLQTLMNTYPDSEYLAKAKLAIADSYFKEGGTAGLTQAVNEYKDFITFFPFLDEAAYAQMQVAMAHYRRMEKADRDRTEAKFAEDEFQSFLQKYPSHPLAAQGEQRLREVQEVLADGEFRIARFYYIKGSRRAAAARLLELTNRYPLYSQADRAMWMLATVFDRAEKGEVAAQYYSRIVRDYPLSGLVDDAKARLTKLGVPIPQPSAEAVARMQRERDLERERPGLLRRSLGMFHSGPDVSMAAHSGKPTMTPAEEAAPATQVASGGGSLAVGTPGTGGGSAVVETVAPGSPGSTPPPASSTSTSAPPASTATTGSENPPKADPNPSEAKPGAEAAKDDKGSNKDKKDAKKDDKKKESSSKKKKGLRKIVPW
jgi:outer membrane protein assembly factor BamD